MKKIEPAWLIEARQFCSKAGIKIIAWGPNALIVEAKSSERAREIASQLGQLGLKTLDDEDDAYAGILTLSRAPAALQTEVASLDVSHRRWDEQLQPFIWAAAAITFIERGVGRSWRYSARLMLAVGFILSVLFLLDAVRIWTWRMEILPEAIRVRRGFRWRTFSKTQIHAVESVQAWSRNQERVVLHLASRTLESLGTFGVVFARRLRDRLRQEIQSR